MPPASMLPEGGFDGVLMDLVDLADAVRSKRVLLVGEDHRFNETLRYLTDLMECLDDRPVSLLLELPSTTQPLLERFLDSGEERDLATLFDSRGTLPFHPLLRWAQQNPARLSRVAAIDQHRHRIASMRCFLVDSRNESMAEAIVEEYRANPEARIIAYGGQLHMLMSGRYRYDQPNRQAVGPRLLAAGIPREEITSIMLSGAGQFALSEVWHRSGAVHLDGELALIPYQYFIGGAVFGPGNAGDLFDYFVNLGPMTEAGS